MRTFLSKLSQSQIFFTVGFSLVCFYILVYGVYFERYIVFLESLFSGSIVGQPLFNFLNIAYIGQSLLFAKLYNAFPSFYWLDFHTIAVGGFTVVAFLWGVAMLAHKRMFGWAAGLLLIANCSTLLHYNLASANSSREAFLLTALLLLIFWGWSSSKPFWKYLLILVGLCWTMLIRYEFALLALILFASFVLVQHKWLRHQWRWFIGPLVLFVAIGSFLYIDRNYSGDFAKESDFSQYLIADADHLKLFESFNDPKDSLRYMAAKELWLSDTANLKIEFFRSLQGYKLGFSINYLQNYFPYYFNRAVEMLQYFLHEYFLFFLLPFALLLYFLIEAYWITGDIRKRWWVLAIPYFMMLMMLFTLSYLVRMETTLLQPAMMLSIMFLLGVGNQPVPVEKQSAARWLKIGLSVFLFVHLIAANNQLYKFVNEREKMLEKNIVVCREADTLAKDKFLVLDGYSNLIYDHRLGNNYVFKQTKNILLYDCGQLILAEPFLSYHAKICQCNPLDNVAFYTFLLNNKQNVLLLSHPQRMAFVIGYMRGMHQMQIGYRKIEGEFKAEQLKDFGLELHYYILTDSVDDNG